MKEYILENQDIKVTFLDYGGIITSMVKKSNETNLVLAYKDYKEYEKNPYYFGATIGRVAGRTYPPVYQNARGETIALDINEGSLSLHGGRKGLDKVVWEVEKQDDRHFVLTYEDRHPLYDTMHFTIHYKLENHIFTIEYEGVSQEPTLCNLTNHTYFNLNKDKTKGIQQHWLKTGQAMIQLIDKEFVPTGLYDAMEEGEHVCFNFKEEKKVQDSLHQTTALSAVCADGIDLAYLFDTTEPQQIVLMSEDKENRLTIRSNQESCVIYTLNKIDQTPDLKDGGKVQKFGGITFEMQRRPNYIHSEEYYLTNQYYAMIQYEIR